MQLVDFAFVRTAGCGRNFTHFCVTARGIFRGYRWVRMEIIEKKITAKDDSPKTKKAFEIERLFQIMVIRPGLEPGTQWLKAICSTD